MARNYHLQSKRQKRSEGKGQLLLIMMAFATGYLSSSIFNINQLSGYLDKNFHAMGLSQTHKLLPKPPQVLASHQPKLEFYTVLTKEADKRVPVATELAKMVRPAQVLEPAKPQVEVAEAKPVKVALETKPQAKIELAKSTQFVVQLASFRYASQAEKFRAKLLLKGFDVKISAIRQGPMQWYRVMLGPYRSVAEAQKAKIIFQAKEHATGMVRQMDA